MKKFKYYILPFVLLVIVATIFFIWHIAKGKHPSEKYRIEKVQYGDVAQTVSANGTLNPVILVNVGTQISGKVEKIYADFNDQVTAGQVLLELDAKLLKAQLAQSLAQVAKANANLSLAKSNEKRGQALIKKKFISPQDWDNLVQARKTAEADLALAEAQLTQDRTNLDYATIRSPVSGVIVDREVDVGQTVAASFQTPVLFKIAQDLSKMQIDSSFAEADIGNIRPGQEAIFSVDAFPESTFKGSVRQIRLNPSIEQNVVTYNVVIVVDNPNGILLPGMTAYVNIKTAERKHVLLVPTAAFRFRPKNDEPRKALVSKVAPAKETVGFGTVYKLVDSNLEPISCKLGITDNRFTEVISDQLKAGDSVVVGYALEGQTAPASSFRVRVF